MANKLKSSLEVFSKSIVQPLMYLSVAGTVLILGILLTNQTITSVVPSCSCRSLPPWARSSTTA